MEKYDLDDFLGLRGKPFATAFVRILRVVLTNIFISEINNIFIWIGGNLSVN